MLCAYRFATVRMTRLSRLRCREANTLGVRSAYSLASLYCANCGKNVGTQRITNVFRIWKLGGCISFLVFLGSAARRGKGISDSAPQGYLLRGTAADLIASIALLRGGRHKARPVSCPALTPGD